MPSKDPYDFHPDETSDDSSADESRSDDDADKEPEVIPLKDEDGPTPTEADATSPDRTPSGRPKRADKLVNLDAGPLDVCPNCGANMPGADEIICLRCGFDLKEGVVREVETGVEELPSPEEVEAAKPKPISPPGRGGLMGPAMAAGLCLLVMCIAFLAGAGGLYHDEDPPGFWMRIGGMFKFLFFVMVLVICIYAGLQVMARVEKRPAGDTQLAFMRAIAIAALSLLSLLIPQPWGSRFLEWTAQFIVGGSIFLAMTLALFRLAPREAITLGGVTVLVLATVTLLAELLASIT